MEVKVFFKNGSVEQHMIPDMVGVSTSRFYQSESREEGTNSIDDITDVVERFY